MKKKVLIPLCIVGAVAMLAGGFFGMMFLQKHLDKRAYEKTDTKLESIFEDSDFIAMDVDERKEKMDSVLDELQDDGQISDIWFDENEKIYGFTYKSGVLGCIALKEHDGKTLLGGYTHSQIIEDAPLSNVNAKTGFDSLTSGGKVKIQFCFSLQDEYKVFFDDVNENWPEDLSKYYKDYDFTLEKLKNLKNRDVYIMAFHGYDYAGESTMVVDADGGKLKYWKDLLRHDVVRFYGDGGRKGKGSYVILPSFFEHNYSKNSMKGSVVIAETCMFYGCDCEGDDIDTTFADMFVDYLGADAVIGFRNSVNADYAANITGYVIADMLNKGSTMETALSRATEEYGENDGDENSSRDKYKAYPILTGNKNKKFIDGADDKSEAENTEAAAKDTTEATVSDTTETDTTEVTESTTVATTEQSSTKQENYTSDNSTDYSGKDYAEKVYGDLIYAYLVKRDNGLGDDGRFEGDRTFDYPYGEDTSGRYNIFLMDGGFSDAGYTITDIDGDGIYEMIFAKLGSSTVYDVFTLVDGKPKMVLDSWERCSLNYGGDCFYRFGSSSATDQSSEKVVLEGDTIKVLNSEFTTLSDRTGELEYYYMDYTRFCSDPDLITKDDYEARISARKNEYCEVPNLISFQEYVEKMSSGNRTASADTSTTGTEFEHWRGIKWVIPAQFSTTINTVENKKITSGEQYVYENKNLDMTIEVWVTMNAYLPYKNGKEFVDDSFNRSKWGEVLYSAEEDDYSVNSGYLDSGRVYYVKYMALDEGDNPRITEIYFEYGQEHKDECDKIVTDFLDSFKKTR